MTYKEALAVQLQARLITEAEHAQALRYFGARELLHRRLPHAAEEAWESVRDNLRAAR